MSYGYSGNSSEKTFEEMDELTFSEEISDSDLTITEIIGNGSMGVIYTGFLGTVPVAIKKPITSSSASKESFKTEFMLHRQLSHPDILKSLGIYKNKMDCWLVFELMIRGSLYHALQDDSVNLPWSVRLTMAHSITNALFYLHEKDILHRDIKSANVLLNDKMKAKLSDFGCAVQINKIKSPTYAGTIRRMSPEIFNEGMPSKSSDIYALAFLFWELASRKVSPFESINNIWDLQELIVNGVREEIPVDTPNQLSSLITRCWANQPCERPSVDVVLDEISVLAHTFFSNRKHMLQSCQSITDRTVAMVDPVYQAWNK